MHRCRFAGLFAPQGRAARLERCRALLGEPEADPSDGLNDDSSKNPFVGDADARDDEEDDNGDDEDEGSYVPCPECGEKTAVRMTIDAGVICDLLKVAAVVLSMLRSGSRQTITMLIHTVVSAAHEERPVLKTLPPHRIEANPYLMRITETLVRDQLRREERARQRATEATQRGPPKQLARA